MFASLLCSGNEKLDYLLGATPIFVFAGAADYVQGLPYCLCYGFGQMTGGLGTTQRGRQTKRHRKGTYLTS